MVENIPVLENEETVHKINEESGTDDEDDGSIHKSVRADDPSLESVETVEDDDDDGSDEPVQDPRIEPDQQPEPESHHHKTEDRPRFRNWIPTSRIVTTGKTVWLVQ